MALKATPNPINIFIKRDLTMINWPNFWSALLGAAFPGFISSLVLLLLNNRNTAKMERYKTTMAEKLVELQTALQNQNARFLHWHHQRMTALVEVYEAFRKYLDFLRRRLYIPGSQGSMDPYFEFRTTIDKNLVFLDDPLQQKIIGLQGELLIFWNWAVQQPRDKGITNDEVQKRLDFEIPSYLDILRKEINDYADWKH